MKTSSYLKEEGIEDGNYSWSNKNKLKNKVSGAHALAHK